MPEFDPLHQEILRKRHPEKYYNNLLKLMMNPGRACAINMLQMNWMTKRNHIILRSTRRAAGEHGEVAARVDEEVMERRCQ